MYLKSLDLQGFKSFADRTQLAFEPGMTAVVGPNGCGKSNIFDAIRWVLGEQSARALRGAKMEDVIFNGADTHKPMGMAEVSLTLADCEERLGTDYNEVTVTRRVLRSGEGQYFINKTPCRLKDVQRLFMDTGIGTSSYSIMEQGRIDQILSARPEDRREVFEEASGITKYKADKKEAIRKLDHTEANLLRLSDIIKEVKRQIISLQRQVGKARRYQELRERLRVLDLFLGRERLGELDGLLREQEAKHADLQARQQTAREGVEKTEHEAGEIRAALSALEEDIARAMDRAGAARNELRRTRESIAIQRERAAELEELSRKSATESEAARAHLEEHRASFEALGREIQAAEAERDAAEKALREETDKLNELEQAAEADRKRAHALRAESVDLDNRQAGLHNELTDLDARERMTVLRRERLAAEKAELERQRTLHEERLREQGERLETLRAEAARRAQTLDDASREQTDRAEALRTLRARAAEIERDASGLRGQLELLRRGRDEGEGFSGGARLLLDPETPLPVDRSTVLGPLAGLLRAEPMYRVALEAVLRAWLDAVVVRDRASALRVLEWVRERSAGSARVLAMPDAADETAPDGPGVPFLRHVACDPKSRPLAVALLGRVRVLDDHETLPERAPEGLTLVTRDGRLVRSDGCFEYWMADEQPSNPVAREHELADRETRLAALEGEQDALRARLQALENAEREGAGALNTARDALDQARREAALCEGEHQVVERQAQQARERAETVSWELEALEKQTGAGGERRTAIVREIEEARNRLAAIRSETERLGETLRACEGRAGDQNRLVTEHRVRHAERRQHVDHLKSREEPLRARIAELEAVIRDRAEGVHSYTQRSEDLLRAVAEAEARIAPLEAEEAAQQAVLEQQRKAREERLAFLARYDVELHERRTTLDALVEQRNTVEIDLAEQRMRRQNLLDRLGAEYHLTPEDIAAAPEPAWPDGVAPDREVIETEAAEARAKLDSMGPVNLVAIEEHKELEERYAFLTGQQDDLVGAKQQLLDMIKKINQTTTEMFSSTFEQVNANFQEVFKQLFGGGSAKLVLIDEENVLDSGIEIIARPPGKKLQSVSLLSGGERTMTAVALMFALYQVKPSPFCVLDEIDAALDESNIGRFVNMLKGFLKDSQFIVVTHNRQTIGMADVLYGVTMEKRGVSKIVSVKFSRHEQQAPAS